MFLKANTGLIVPMEGDYRRYITAEKITQVEETAYYLRKITDGDLVEANEAGWDAQEKSRIASEEATVKAALKAAKASGE